MRVRGGGKKEEEESISEEGGEPILLGMKEILFVC